MSTRQKTSAADEPVYEYGSSVLFEDDLDELQDSRLNQLNKTELKFLVVDLIRERSVLMRLVHDLFEASSMTEQTAMQTPPAATLCVSRGTHTEGFLFDPRAIDRELQTGNAGDVVSKYKVTREAPTNRDDNIREKQDAVDLSIIHCSSSEQPQVAKKRRKTGILQLLVVRVLETTGQPLRVTSIQTELQKTFGYDTTNQQLRGLLKAKPKIFQRHSDIPMTWELVKQQPDAVKPEAPPIPASSTSAHAHSANISAATVSLCDGHGAVSDNTGLSPSTPSSIDPRTSQSSRSRNSESGSADCSNSPLAIETHESPICEPASKRPRVLETPATKEIGNEQGISPVCIAPSPLDAAEAENPGAGAKEQRRPIGHVYLQAVQNFAQHPIIPEPPLRDLVQTAAGIATTSLGAARPPE
eukprot:ANDGO_04219.mRNA.1 hypothetical protein